MPLNWKHIEACCAGATLGIAEYNGQRLLANGHILFAFNGEFDVPADIKDQPKASALWKKSLAAEVIPAEVGGTYQEGRDLARKVGVAFVAERYFRCFGDATWMAAGSHEPVLVHCDGALIGIVMPVRNANGPPNEKEFTDAEVFAPFAFEDNGWYLMTRQAMKRKLQEAEDEMESAKEARDRAQAEYDWYYREAESLRERLRTMQVHG